MYYYSFLAYAIFSCFCVSSVVAQNALILGKITNNNKFTEVIDLQVNHRYIDGNIDNYQSKITEDGAFAFAVTITEPQLVDLYYARNQAQLYIEPNDTLYVNFDANTFKFSFDFSGRSGENNRYLTDYEKKHPRELNPFQYIQYKSGQYWYKIEPEKDQEMRSMTRTEYVQKIGLQKEKNLSDLAFYAKNNPDNLTDDFKDFMRAEIIYDWAYNMLFFGTIYKNHHEIEPAFFTFLNEMPTQSDYIGSYAYQLFLEAYLNHEYLKIAEEGDIHYLKKYALAEKLLEGKAMAFIQSEQITKAFNKRYIEETLPVYNDFIEKNAYISYDDKIVASLQKMTRTAIGTNAPEFVFNKNSPQKISLSDMEGNIVVLNFWASWCRPCIKKMKELKPMQDELEQKVLFVHISFDKSPDTWKETVEEYDFKGIHLFAPQNVKSDIAKNYNVRAIPQYFIIDKKGKFAEKPLFFTPEVLRKTLLSLNTAN